MAAKKPSQRHRRPLIDDAPHSSSLPSPRVERFNIDDEKGSHSMLRVECPSCRHDYWVQGGVWLPGVKREGVRYRTSSCPYCFKTHKRVAPSNN